jgi:hypothetical protein
MRERKENKKIETYGLGAKKKFGIVFEKGSMACDDQAKVSSFLAKKRTAGEMMMDD